MVPPPPRPGSFSPNPAQALQTGPGHSQHQSQAAVLSAAASPSTGSPTGSSSLTKIVVAQVYLLLSTIKDENDPKYGAQVSQLRKLIDDYGMEVYSRFFTRLVAGSASQIFPGHNRQVANPANYQLLKAEIRKVAHDVDQASRIAESIETGTEDIFRDFDLSTFMEHFKMDALEKTFLALAFKTCSRSDLRTKADAILSTNFPTFVYIISRPDLSEHADLSPAFISLVVDRLIQYPAPNFTASPRQELASKVKSRYFLQDQPPPSEVLAALDLVRILGEQPSSDLALYMQRVGADFTKDEETCVQYLENRPGGVQLDEDQVSTGLLYCVISQNPQFDASVFAASLGRVLPSTFSWFNAISCFDRETTRISPDQFLRLYKALRPLAQGGEARRLDIQELWGGSWENAEARLSFVCAFASLTPEQLDASTIPGLVPTISMDSYADSPKAVQDRASEAVKHPLVSAAALSVVFHVALHSVEASQSVEAKRLFQDVVVPNLDIFVVSAFGMPRPWPTMAMETLNSLFENFLYKKSPEYDFVLDSLWKKDKDWVAQRLMDAHAANPMDLPLIYEHTTRHGWLDELAYEPNGLGLDLAAVAHAENRLDLDEWARRNSDRAREVANSILRFLMIKATLEIKAQRPQDNQPALKSAMPLQVRTVSKLLQVLEEVTLGASSPELVAVQRCCITAYPRLINYGQDFDDILDASGKTGNALPLAANAKMEEHYKKMYGNEIEVGNIVDVLNGYKRSRDPLEQDVFACMIHGLFDEYTHYSDYPLEALATTAVLFGGIISRNLISGLPLTIGLGMIIEAVRDHAPEASMFKFGLQALMQMRSRFSEWPAYCRQLLLIQGLNNTQVYIKAEEVVREQDEMARGAHNGAAAAPPVPLGAYSAESLANGVAEEALASEQQAPPFTAISVDPPRPGMEFEEPSGEDQGKIQFVLNNLTETTLLSMCKELREMVDQKHQQWFATHLVEERAKMQPNYHRVYLDLVDLFEDQWLWAEVLRETYISVARMLNAEATMQNSTERSHLKNLGGWLGLLTLARNKPIKHRNIAFKQLLIEAHDTKRLVVVIPFVCKVLSSGAVSTVFRPPNPWLMDIIRLLIELYHHAELKLNLKFEIEVLCNGLQLDHKSIEPSTEIVNRVVPVEEAGEALVTDAMDGFDTMSLNGMAPPVPGALTSQAMTPVVPDVGPLISIPPTNEMVVTSSRLHELVRTSLTRALHDIIQPVVDRSVTIAAISTQHMIHKDFAIEPDENRVRACAVNMVKSTAGSLALVTSKEPLRANFTNYLRNISNDFNQALPEGTIMMCVSSNLDLGCSIIEKQAEERAVPEIEEMMEAELESRRRHRAQKPLEPYAGPSLNRWASAIPQPFRLVEGMTGLTPEQMAIYEDFARQPRNSATATGPSHAPSASDTTRSLANEVLQEQFSSLPGLAASSETQSMGHMGATQIQAYPPTHAAGATGAAVAAAAGSTVGTAATAAAAAAAAAAATGATNGRAQPTAPIDLPSVAAKFQKLLLELQRQGSEAREEHFVDLPRPHNVLDVVDALVQLIIRSQGNEDIAVFGADQISQLLFTHIDDNLTLESLVHVLETLRKISGPAVSSRISAIFRQQPGHFFLQLPLLTALARTDLIEWRNIDTAMAKALQQRKEGSLEFLEQLMDLSLLGDRPLALYSDFVRTLEAAWAWILEDGELAAGQSVKAKLIGSGLPRPSAGVGAGTDGNGNGNGNSNGNGLVGQDQMEYVFDEWVHLCSNPNATEKSMLVFLQQAQVRRVIGTKDDMLVFIRLAIDQSVDRNEQLTHSGGSRADGFVAVDALAHLIAIFVRMRSSTTNSGHESRPAFLESILALVTLVLHHHHTKRGEHLNQRVFFRLMSMTLHEINLMAQQLPSGECLEMMIKFATALKDMGPKMLPGFAFAWMSLVQHRVFLPVMVGCNSDAGQGPFTVLVCQLLEYLGGQLKAPSLTAVAKDVYRAVLKLLIVLHHDFPDYLVSYHQQLCQYIPTHCAQLLAAVLTATPLSSSSKASHDPTHPELRVEVGDELQEVPLVERAVADTLDKYGVLEVLDQALRDGPSEALLAHIAHAMGRPDGNETGFGYAPVSVNLALVDAVPRHVVDFAVERARQKGGPVYVPTSSDCAVLVLLVRELHPEARYYLLSAMVNQLRYENAHTHYFIQLILDIFAQDGGDVQETVTRQQIVRILLERLVGFWALPWGLMVTVTELVKNDKYMFFEQPCIKGAPEVADRFVAVASGR